MSIFLSLNATNCLCQFYLCVNILGWISFVECKNSFHFKNSVIGAEKINQIGQRIETPSL